DTPGIIRLSSNVGAALASESVDARAFYNMLKLFSFGEETGIELNGEERGLIARPEDWSARTQPTIAIGQEIGVTAIQLVSGATVYANRGVLLKPNIIDKIVTADGRIIRNYGRAPVREVLSPDVAAIVLAAMESAVRDDGTARRLRYEGLRIAAKTGTAEKIDPETGTYSDDAFLASTLAILPVGDPQLIIYVAIDHPRGEQFYGGRIAAPLVREYLDFLVPYLGIPVDGDTSIGQPGRITVQPVILPDLEDTIPDYTGLPKRALLPLLTRTDLTVTLGGYGWVVSQDPPPGAPFSAGMVLHLEFE
ncbi:MAG: penicillin-binding transpeptidase domain-containing protein, partial [Spirochaetia bacterium]